MAEKPSPIRPTDDEALKLARTLLRGAPWGALAVSDPDSGFPNVSRVIIGTDVDCCPVILVSQLSAHTRAIMADPRVGLLTGEPGPKGDPLTWPRLSLQARAVPVDRDDPGFAVLRTRFLNRHPKAKLYADFGDFRFLRLIPDSAGLNGGFGKAYKIAGSDLLLDASEGAALRDEWDMITRQFLTDSTALANHLAQRHFSDNGRTWRISNVDFSGFDLSNGNKLRRYELNNKVSNCKELFNIYFSLLNEMH